MTNRERADKAWATLHDESIHVDARRGYLEGLLDAIEVQAEARGRAEGLKEAAQLANSRIAPAGKPRSPTRDDTAAEICDRLMEKLRALASDTCVRLPDGGTK